MDYGWAIKAVGALVGVAWPVLMFRVRDPERPLAPRSFFRFLYHRFVRGYEVPRMPHMDPEALHVFMDHLTSANFYLEFGAGGSTIAAKRLKKRGISVEADLHYAALIRKALGPHSKMEVIGVPIGLTREWSYPLFTSVTRNRGRRWARYPAAPFERMDGEFPDFVLIDGRFRSACALATVMMAGLQRKPTTILIDDYFADQVGERGYYTAVEEFIGTPERVGRAALFSVPENLERLPTKWDMDKALRDFR